MLHLPSCCVFPPPLPLLPPQPDWKVKGDHIDFETAQLHDSERGRVGAADAPALIQTALHYATEVEKIV